MAQLKWGVTVGTGLLVVVLIVVIYYASRRGFENPGDAAARPSGIPGFDHPQHPGYPDPNLVDNPERAALSRDLSALAEFGPTASGGSILAGGSGPLSARYASGARPHELQRAYTLAWMKQREAASDAAGAPPAAPSLAADYTPALTHSDRMLAEVATPKMREAHDDWHREVAPLSQTAHIVDDMEEAAAMSIHRVGITAFRSHEVPQSRDALFLTHTGPEEIATQFRRFDFV